MKKITVVFIACLVFVFSGFVDAQTLVSSYTWDGKAAPNYSFSPSIGKCYMLKVSGYFSDSSGVLSNYQDAFYGFDSSKQSSPVKIGNWWTGSSPFDSLIPSPATYSQAHVYTYFYKNCTGLPETMTLAYDDTDYTNNVSNLKFEWFEMLPCDPNVVKVDLGNDRETCYADALVLDAGNPGAKYLWSTGDTTRKLTVNKSGPYSVLVSNYSCTAKDTINVVVNPELKGNYSVTTFPDCNQSNGEITVTAAGGKPTYKYSIDNGKTFTSTVTYSNLSVGTYTVIVKDSIGCDDTVIVSLSPIQFSYVKQDIKCGGQPTGSIDITVSGLYPPHKYQWSGGATTNSEDLTNLKAGTYVLKITDNKSCTLDTTITISEPAPLQLSYKKTALCGGKTLGDIDVSVSGGKKPYSYQWSGESSATTEDLSNVGPGLYTIAITDSNQCVWTETINMGELVLTFATSGCPVNGDVKVDLTVTGGNAPYKYQWSNGSASEDQQGIKDRELYVTVLDANNCIGSGYVVTGKNDQVPCFSIPNVFTPNADGVNDTWVIRDLVNYKDAKVSVFNRWGELIFFSDDYSTPWDGTVNGKELPVADYYYVIELDKSTQVKGYITIKR